MRRNLFAAALCLTCLAAAAGDAPRDFDRLASELGSPEFPIREAASKALGEAGEAARGSLEKAAQSKDPEIQARAQALLASLDAERGKQEKAERRKRMPEKQRQKIEQLEAQRAQQVQAFQNQPLPPGFMERITQHLDAQIHRYEAMSAEEFAQAEKQENDARQAIVQRQMMVQAGGGQVVMQVGGKRLQFNEGDMERMEALNGKTFPALGLRCAACPEELAGHLRVEGGVLVRELMFEPLKGLEKHDVIAAAGADPLKDLEAFEALVKEKAGKAVELTVYRQGAKRTVTVTLPEAKDKEGVQPEEVPEP